MKQFRFLYLCKYIAQWNKMRGTEKQVANIAEQFKDCPYQLERLLQNRNII